MIGSVFFELGQEKLMPMKILDSDALDLVDTAGAVKVAHRNSKETKVSAQISRRIWDISMSVCSYSHLCVSYHPILCPSKTTHGRPVLVQ